MQRLIAAALLCTAAMFAAGVDGKWTAEIKTRNGEVRTTTFNFKADGDKLTGTIRGMGPMEREISDGKINGDEISFSVKMNVQGTERLMKYTGKVAGDEIQFKLDGPRAREFTAKRAGS